MGAPQRRVGDARLRVRRSRLRRAKARELPRGRRRTRGRLRALLDVEVVRDGGLAARLRRRQRGDRRADRGAAEPPVRRRSSCRSRRRASPRSPARRTRSRSGARSTSAARPRARRARGPRRAQRGHVLRLVPASRTGLTASALLEEHRVAVAPGEGFGERGRGWARLSLATPDEPARPRARAAQRRARSLQRGARC